MIHRDKHGPAVGVYSSEKVEVSNRLQKLCDDAGAVLVPFAIPPMLARWDRALAELRAVWDESERGEFPVPPAENPSHWTRRRRRKEKKKRKKKKQKAKDGEE